MFTLKIDTRGTAFRGGNRPYEVAQILRIVARDVGACRMAGKLTDSNGEPCGEYDDETAEEQAERERLDAERNSPVPFSAPEFGPLQRKLLVVIDGAESYFDDLGTGLDDGIYDEGADDLAAYEAGPDLDATALTYALAACAVLIEPDRYGFDGTTPDCMQKVIDLARVATGHDKPRGCALPVPATVEG